jgi:hypothetical protein
VTFEPPDAPEGGLPGKQGEFAISLPWAARFGLTAAIGAVLGLAAASVIPARGLGQASAWIIVMAGAIAATYLSIRRVHGWHVSTFVDGTIVGLVAAPLFAILLLPVLSSDISSEARSCALARPARPPSRRFCTRAAPRASTGTSSSAWFSPVPA